MPLKIKKSIIIVKKFLFFLEISKSASGKKSLKCRELHLLIFLYGKTVHIYTIDCIYEVNIL